MKNLLVYINPSERFNCESENLAKIQIDNALDLCWARDDILFVTNFPFEYRGIKTTIIDGNVFCPFRPLSTKTLTVNYLLHNDLLDDDIYWVHDLDAYQVERFPDFEMKDVAFTDYGWSSKWCLGSYFFKRNAKDIFEWIKDRIFDIHNEDERALVSLTRENFKGINDRITKLDISYQIGMRHVDDNIKKADKPLKVLHFHPQREGLLDIFMYGNNCTEMPLMSGRLTRSFHAHGYK